MNVGIDLMGIRDLDTLLHQIPALAQQNIVNACLLAANDARNLLRDATKGPRSGRVSQEVGEAWTVVPEPTGASVINTHEVAAYLEFGVGIFNEGPGLKGPIVPRRGKFLRWVGDDGKVHFARKVKGFKGVAMVRGNWENLQRLARQHAENAARFTSEGRAYA